MFNAMYASDSFTLSNICWYISFEILKCSTGSVDIFDAMLLLTLTTASSKLDISDSKLYLNNPASDLLTIDINLSGSDNTSTAFM